METPQWPPPPQPTGDNRVILGVVLAIGLHVLQVPLAIVVGLIGCGLESMDGYCAFFAFVPLLFIGVSQIAYQGPTAFLLWKRNSRSLLQGLIIGAAATFLLNAACWGLLVGGGTLLG